MKSILPDDYTIPYLTFEKLIYSQLRCQSCTALVWSESRHLTFHRRWMQALTSVFESGPLRKVCRDLLYLQEENLCVSGSTEAHNDNLIIV